MGWDGTDMANSIALSAQVFYASGMTHLMQEDEGSETSEGCVTARLHAVVWSMTCLAKI
jgi:hypothetical protein